MAANIYSSKSELDSLERATFNRDTAYSVHESDMTGHVDVTVRGDSIFQHMVYHDTTFCASRGDILKKFKGYYFLNRKILNNSRLVTKLTKTKNGINLGRVSKTEDIKKLESVD